MADEAKKPVDFLERFAGKDFDGDGGVSVATVPSQADPAKLLFQQGGGQPGGEEGDDEILIWDEEPATVAKYGQGMFRADVKVGEKIFRYWGKKRIDVMKQLIQAQENPSKKIQEQSAALAAAAANPPANHLPNRVPDTKLPFDPIPRRAPRQFTDQEIMGLQEMEQSDPARAFRMKLEAVTGYTPEGFIAAIDEVNNSK